MTKQWKPEIRAHRAFREPLVMTMPGSGDGERDALDVEKATAPLANLSRSLRRPVVLVLGNGCKPVIGR